MPESRGSGGRALDGAAAAGTVARGTAALVALLAPLAVFALPDAARADVPRVDPAQVDAAHAVPGARPDHILQRRVAALRADFLEKQPFNRFDVAVLLRDRAGQWRSGSAGGERLAYPASCVKLAYLVAAVHWCAENGRAPDCLDEWVRPMIVESDNVATGEVLDRISGTTNHVDPAADATSSARAGAAAGAAAVTDAAQFPAWLQRRGYAERVLAAYGLLGGQRLLHKTYPTNSGEEPGGFEQRALVSQGRNAMSPELAAALMLGIVSGRVEPQATDYMRRLLRRDRYTAHGSFAAGLPPGTLQENKIGTAFDTLEDIAWFRLPNGREAIVAAFSNGWDQREPEPWDVLRFSGFTERLVPALGLQRGLPFQRVVAMKSGARLRAPADGRYELSAWYEPDPSASGSVDYEWRSGATATHVRFDLRYWSARWLPLGEIELHAGETLALTARVDAAADGGTVPRLPASRVRFARIPAP
jgi:protein phosphatase methylesterase 1